MYRAVGASWARQKPRPTNYFLNSGKQKNMKKSKIKNNIPAQPLDRVGSPRNLTLAFTANTEMDTNNKAITRVNVRDRPTCRAF